LGPFYRGLTREADPRIFGNDLCHGAVLAAASAALVGDLAALAAD